MVLIIGLAIFIFLFLFTLYCMLKVAKMSDEQMFNNLENQEKSFEK